MTNPSAVGAAIDALVATFNAAGIVTYDGPGRSDDASTAYVFVGLDDVDSDTYVTAAVGKQGWAWLGHNQRDEEFTVKCYAVAWNGDGDQKAARDAVFALLGKVTDAITTDPSLGGALLYAPGITSYDLRQTQSNNGVAAHLPFDVECRARLS